MLRRIGLTNFKCFEALPQFCASHWVPPRGDMSGLP